MTRSRVVLVIVALALGFAGPGAAQPVIGPSAGGEASDDDGLPPGGAGPAQPQPPLPPSPETPGIALQEPMWVAVDGKTTGPFEPPEIARKIMAGEIAGDTLVYTGSLNRWVRAGEVAVLAPLLRHVAERGGSGASAKGDAERVARFTEYMLGEWEFAWPFAPDGAPARAYVRYRPDGTFRGYVTTTDVDQKGWRTSDSEFRGGTWSVQPVDDRHFELLLSYVVKATGENFNGKTQYEILGPNRKRETDTKEIAVRVANY